MPGSHQTWPTALSDYNMDFSTLICDSGGCDRRHRTRKCFAFFSMAVWSMWKQSTQVKIKDAYVCWLEQLRHHNNASQKKSKDKHDFSGWLFTLFDLEWHDRCAASHLLCFRIFKQKLVVKTGACAKGQANISLSKLLFSKETIGVRFPRLLGDLTFQFEVHFCNLRGVGSCISEEFLLVIWHVLSLPCLIDVCGHTVCRSRVDRRRRKTFIYVRLKHSYIRA